MTWLQSRSMSYRSLKLSFVHARFIHNDNIIHNMQNIINYIEKYKNCMNVYKKLCS